MLSNCVAERTLKSPLDSKEIKPVDPNGNQLWIFIGRTDAEAPYFGHLMRRDDSLEKPWCRERLNDGGVEGDKGWDVWMSLAQWTWDWASSGRQSRTGKPGVLQFMGSERIRHSWTTETTLFTGLLKRSASSVWHCLQDFIILSNFSHLI